MKTRDVNGFQDALMNVMEMSLNMLDDSHLNSYCIIICLSEMITFIIIDAQIWNQAL